MLPRHLPLSASLVGDALFGVALMAQGQPVAAEAQVPTTVLGAFVFAFVTVVGLVAWIVKRLFDVTIPDQQKLFERQQNKAQEVFEQQMKDQRLMFESANAKAQSFFETASQKAQELFRDQVREERAFFRDNLQVIINTFTLAHRDILTRMDAQQSTIAQQAQAILSNQAALRECVQIAQDHYDHWRQWTDDQARGRRPPAAKP